MSVQTETIIQTAAKLLEMVIALETERDDAVSHAEKVEIRCSAAIARAERAEVERNGAATRAQLCQAALAGRNQPCVHVYHENNWASTYCGQYVPNAWGWRFCAFCGHPVKTERIASDNDLLSAGREAGNQ